MVRFTSSRRLFKAAIQQQPVHGSWDGSSALQKLEAARKAGHVDPSLYHSALRASPQSTMDLFRKMREDGKRIDGPLYGLILRNLSNLGDVQQCEGVLQCMQGENGVNVPNNAYAQLIRAYGKAGQFEQAVKLFESLKAAKKVGGSTYAALMDVSLQQGSVNACHRYFWEMVQSGIQASVVDCNRLLHAFMRKRETASAMKLYAKMADGTFPAPNQITLSTMIAVSSLTKDLEQFRAFFNKLCEYDHLLDGSILYIIRGLSSFRRTEEADNFVRSLEEQNRRVPETAYFRLIHGYANAQMPDKFPDIVSRVTRKGALKSKTGLMNCLYKGLLTTGRHNDAERLWQQEDFVKNSSSYEIRLEHGVSRNLPDVDLSSNQVGNIRRGGFIGRLQLAIQRGLLQDAVKMVTRDLPENQRLPEKMWSELIQTCAQKGLHDCVLRLAHVMQRSGVDMTTATYSALIRSYGMVKDGGMILKLLNEMDAKGLTPSLVTQAEVVQGLWSSGLPTKACEYFERTCQQGVRPSAKGMAVVLRLYAASEERSEDFRRVEQMALQLADQNLVRLVLAEIYADKGDEEKLQDLFQSVAPERRNFSYHLHLLAAYVRFRRGGPRKPHIEQKVNELVATLMEETDKAKDGELVKFMALAPSHSEEIFNRAGGPRRGNLHAGFLEAYCDNPSADLESFIKLTDDVMSLDMSLSATLCLKLITRLASLEGWHSERALIMFSRYSVEHLAPLRGFVVPHNGATELRRLHRFPAAIPVAIRFLLSKQNRLPQGQDVLITGVTSAGKTLSNVIAAGLVVSKTPRNDVYRIKNSHLLKWLERPHADVHADIQDEVRA